LIAMRFTGTGLVFLMLSLLSCNPVAVNLGGSPAAGDTNSPGNTDSDSGADADSDVDSDADSDMDSDSDSDADTDADADRDSDSGIDTGDGSTDDETTDTETTWNAPDAGPDAGEVFDLGAQSRRKTCEPEFDRAGSFCYPSGPESF
jgi:hypothetical protein